MWKASAALLLPWSLYAWHITGVVMDPQGRPIAGASIGNSGDTRKLHETDAAGRFDLDLNTQASAVVIRKAGFRSALLRTDQTPEIRVTLRPLERPGFPVCTGKRSYVGIEGSGARFEFPRVRGVLVSDIGRDADYVQRDHYIQTKSGPRGIRHGSGALWTFGTARDQEVWGSVQYRESAYQSGRQTIVDARGQMGNGTWWRYLGSFGESASYSGVDKATAKILDRVLDGACLKPATQFP